jgi:hypothetical protein
VVAGGGGTFANSDRVILLLHGIRVLVSDIGCSPYQTDSNVNRSGLIAAQMARSLLPGGDMNKIRAALYARVSSGQQATAHPIQVTVAGSRLGDLSARASGPLFNALRLAS